MKLKSYLSSLTAFVLAFSLLSATLPFAAYASAPAAVRASDTDLEQRLARIEAKFTARQKELGIPGISVAIVKDGKVVLSKGYGYKDFENKIKMTPDTQLAIGSATKAFTALSVLMLSDEKKLSLDDSPRKYLPYFKINNAETNEKIQIRDLMSHSSGLNRTDLAMITGKLNRKELIQVAGEAKPSAGLREKFYYQNIMFTAAGEIVAEVTKMPWEKFIANRVFAPLGMNNSSISVKQMQKSKDFSFGYIYNFDSKETKKLPTRVIDEIAPAGSINSTSNDMAKWLQFTLAGGEYGGKRLISKESFDEWTKPQMKITPDGKVSYGLGWFVQEWKGKKVIQHGGNIDGFNSMVAMMPEENLGFVVLTNVSASSLGNEMMQMVWSGMLEDKKKVLKAGPEQEKEVGVYLMPQAGFDIEISIENDELVMKVPGQPTYPLILVEGRKYELGGTPGGYFITFNDEGALMEQPQGMAPLKKKGAVEKKAAPATDSLKELIGKYKADGGQDAFVEVKDVDGEVSLIAPSQPPYPLQEKSKDLYISPSLPDGYSLKVLRGDNGLISGITLFQPNGEFGFTRVADDDKKETPAVKISADELIAKTVAAMGGEDNLRKITSRKIEFTIDAIHQGVKGNGFSVTKAPNKSVSRTTLTALGKKIGWIEDYFDGTKSSEYLSFSVEQIATGQRLADISFGNDFYPFLDLKDKLEKAEVLRMEKLDDKQVYVLALFPKAATKVVYRISADTFLPVRMDSVVVSSTSAQRINQVQLFEDYREVDGVEVPHKTTTRVDGIGDIISVITKVTDNVVAPDNMFVKK